MKVAELFAGIGGFHYGVKALNWPVVYANENNPSAAKTYALNHGMEVDTRSVMDVKGDDLPEYDCLVGGFPCQPFSQMNAIGEKREKHKSGNLFLEIVRLMKETRPKLVILENVKALTRIDNAKIFQRIQQESVSYTHLTLPTILLV